MTSKGSNSQGPKLRNSAYVYLKRDLWLYQGPFFSFYIVSPADQKLTKTQFLGRQCNHANSIFDRMRILYENIMIADWQVWFQLRCRATGFAWKTTLCKCPGYRCQKWLEINDIPTERYETDEKNYSQPDDFRKNGAGLLQIAILVSLSW